jgi:L-xylulokinase
MKSLYLGIDVGGTVAKAALFDERGKEVAASARPIPTLHPQPGFTERDAEQMWRAAADAVREVLSRSASMAADIAAVCCTGHGNGIYLVDAGGKPVCNGVVSSDMRSFHLVAELDAHARAGEFREIIGQQFRSDMPLALLAWYDRHRPDVSQRANYALLCKDYVRFRLTGRLESDHCDLSGSRLLDLSSGQYAAEVFRGLGLERWLDRMPPIRRNTDICGTVTPTAATETGLAAGTPVATGMMDLAAATLASGVLDASRLAICAGTWSINLLVAQERCRGRLPLMQALHQNGTRFIVCEGSPTSATNLAWMLDTILGDARPGYDEINAMVAGLPPEASSLVYLPYIHGGAGAPRASFVGLGSESGKAHLLRAMFEGVVFGHKSHIDTIAQLTCHRPKVARLSGGAARSPVWAQMFADVLNMEIEIAEGSELGALGCAICAAVAVGRYDGFETAVAAMTTVRDRFDPDPSAVSVYDRKRAAFHSVDRALNRVWPDL